MLSRSHVISIWSTGSTCGRRLSVVPIFAIASLAWIHAAPQNSWWRHPMETFSALLAICAGNSPVPGEFLGQRPVTRSFGVFFDLRLNKRLSKQSWGWWLETLSRPSWRHHNVIQIPDYCSVHPLHSVASHRGSLGPGDAYIYIVIYIYIRQRNLSSLVQKMACRLIGVEPLSEPVMTYYLLDAQEHTSVEFISKQQKFSRMKLHLRICLQITAILSGLYVFVPCQKALDGDLSCHFMAYFTTWCKIFLVMFYSEIAKISPFSW